MATLATADTFSSRSHTPELEARAAVPFTALQDSAAAQASRAAPQAPGYVLSWTPDSPWKKIPLPPASAFFGASQSPCDLASRFNRPAVLTCMSVVAVV